jgi:hypothetical protein
MNYDCDVLLTRKDGSVRNFRLYGKPTPHQGDIITLPVDGGIVKARISEPSQGSEMVQSVDRAAAVEI